MKRMIVKWREVLRSEEMTEREKVHRLAELANWYLIIGIWIGGVTAMLGIFIARYLETMAR